MITPYKEHSIGMLIGTSSDTKPTISTTNEYAEEWNGRLFYEIDTKTFYMYNSESGAWVEQ